jgi:hypothetical protein
MRRGRHEGFGKQGISHLPLLRPNTEYVPPVLFLTAGRCEPDENSPTTESR